MSVLTYQPITSLVPIKPVYRFYKEEPLNTTNVIFRSGYNFINLDGFNNFQDITISNSSCFILTSSISLSSFFKNDSKKELGQLPGSVILQSKETSVFYAGYDKDNNLIVNSFEPVVFLLYPVNDSEVELKVNGMFVQVDETYPYHVRLNKTPLNEDEIHRQRFIYYYHNNTLTLKTLTSSGYRYLSFTKDGTMKATGFILNIATLHNYALQVFEVTTDSLEYGFQPKNSWVTYFQDFESQANNENLSINKVFSDTAINFLVNFELKNSITTGEAPINIANLKTEFTPTGGPAPVDNTYEKTIITSN